MFRIPVPTETNLEEIKQKINEFIKTESVCAFVFEPLILGAGGSMQMYRAHLLDEILYICKQHHIITIADEVMTGFYRTGKFLAIEYLKANQPDIVCLSKGITGGVMPLGVTICAQFIYEAYLSDDKTKTFFHGHSYTANPTACAAALASLDLLEKKETWQNIKQISSLHEKFKEKIKLHPGILSVRNLGTIIAIEIKTPQESGYLNNLAEKISSYFIKRGILLRPLGNVLYILPPYCISEADLIYIYASIEDFLNNEV